MLISQIYQTNWVCVCICAVAYGRQMWRLKLYANQRMYVISHYNERWKWRMAMQCVRAMRSDILFISLYLQKWTWKIMTWSCLYTFSEKETFNLSFLWYCVKWAEKATSRVSYVMLTLIVYVWVCVYGLVHKQSSKIECSMKDRSEFRFELAEPHTKRTSHLTSRRHMFQTT